MPLKTELGMVKAQLQLSQAAAETRISGLQTDLENYRKRSDNLDTDLKHCLHASAKMEAELRQDFQNFKAGP